MSLMLTKLPEPTENYALQYHVKLVSPEFNKTKGSSLAE